jgi:hypothetical protein
MYFYHDIILPKKLIFIMKLRKKLMKDRFNSQHSNSLPIAGLLALAMTGFTAVMT